MNRMISVMSRVGNIMHEFEVVVGPDGFLCPLKTILGIEMRLRVVVYAVEHVLLILGALQPWNGALSLDSY